ncbi:MAG TPA: hypothetical protein PK306_23920, partial [Aquabacterium sp.]|nr:hypothetical protein [Aquabacterium sp.]
MTNLLYGAMLDDGPICYAPLGKSVESMRDDLDADTVAAGENVAAIDSPFLLSAANVAPSSAMAGTFIFSRRAVPPRFEGMTLPLNPVALSALVTRPC